MTTDQLVFFLAGIAIGFDLALLVHFGGRHLATRRALRQARSAFEKARKHQLVPEELRGGFWRDMTGGMCAVCHIAVNRGEDPNPLHPVCLVIHDGMRITAGPDRLDDVLIHLPQFTYWDTQVWSAELGIPTAHLPALKAVLEAHLAQKEGNQP